MPDKNSKQQKIPDNTSETCVAVYEQAEKISKMDPDLVSTPETSR